jgi:hypothetical protein
VNGVFAARAEAAQLTKTSKGDPQVLVVFEILSPGPQQGSKIGWYGFFTPKTQERTLEALYACGWHGPDLTDLSGVGDREVEIVVEEEEYQGKVRSKVRWVNVPGRGANISPLPVNEATAFAARMKGLAAKVAQDVAKREKEEPMPF